jgi:hypothetical protein
MEDRFDSAKDKINREKRGLPLIFAGVCSPMTTI